MLKNNTKAYGSIAKAFHWIMFLLVVAMLCVGFYMVGLEATPDKFKIYGWHKSFGATLLFLALLRVLWRFTNPVPLLPKHLNSAQRFAAKATHILLYTLLIVMPLSGWLMSSAAGFSVSFFGLFTLPNLIAADKEVLAFLKEAHEILALLLIGLAMLHIAAALLHHFYYKDNVLRRMLPFVKSN